MDREPRASRIIRHASALGCWEMAFTPPHPRLQGLVDVYIGYDERSTSFTRRHELPGIQAVLIVNLGDPITITDTAGHVVPVGSGCGFAAGLSDAYAISESRGSQRGVQIMFTPEGAQRFFRLPMHLLANRVFPLDDLLGQDATRLIGQLQDAEDWAACFALLDVAILQRLGEPDAAARGIAWALRQLTASRGRLPVGALATELGYSRKHLAGLFREHVGLPPKTVARLLRFRQVLDLVDAADSVNWSGIAQEAGYFDQAHFSRDFRIITGCTPTEYMARRLPGQAGLPVG